MPLTTNWSEASKKQQKHKKVKKYSKAWWRQYRARLRRQRALNNRKRELARRREQNRLSPRNAQVAQKSSASMVAGWSGESVASSGEAKYSVADASGRAIGSAQLSVVGAAMPAAETDMTGKMREKSLGGVPVSALRRTVIDKMIREEGWIVNDYQREVGGKRIFVVVAQTQNASSTNSRLFYFTAVDGRIYSLSTTAPKDYSDKIAADSEQFLEKLQRSDNKVEDVTATTSLR